MVLDFRTPADTHEITVPLDRSHTLSFITHMEQNYDGDGDLHILNSSFVFLGYSVLFLDVVVVVVVVRIIDFHFICFQPFFLV